MRRPLRRKTKICTVGSLKIGGGAPIVIQSMCSTKTENARSTVAQILKLKREGCELVRIAVPNFEAAEKIPLIKKRIGIPLVADIHFDYRLAIEAVKNGADKIRINPGNIGGHDRVSEILQIAKKYNAAVRLGVNAGSLEQRLWTKYGRPSPDALTESAVDWIKVFEKNKFYNFVVSIKSSDVPETVCAYEMLAEKCDYPLHLGVTEAGLPPYGAIKSAIGIGSLLLKGIGDTIRVSLTGDPVEEIKACKQILKALHLYNKEPEMIACPTCGRTEINLIKLAKSINRRLLKIHRPIKVAVMGCMVNGPGEAREADWGIAGGKGTCAIFRKGKVLKWVKEENALDELFKMIKKEG